jgi:IS30 family transposase
VENTNGLIRQYLPKHLSAARHKNELDAIAKAVESPAAQDPPMAFPAEVLAAEVAHSGHGVASTT